MNRKEEKFDSEEFDSFLSKIKEIDSIIKEMSSSNAEISKKGIEKADNYFSKEALEQNEDGIFTVYNKSSFNKKALESNNEAPSYSHMTAEEFKAAAEKDAQERFKRNCQK